MIFKTSQLETEILSIVNDFSVATKQSQNSSYKRKRLQSISSDNSGSPVSMKHSDSKQYQVKKTSTTRNETEQTKQNLSKTSAVVHEFNQLSAVTSQLVNLSPLSESGIIFEKLK